ncbi:carbohydrate esterase family 4 protein [Gonapodya prolifera JEL478]|uniref:Carbohydrate esterase family 4 protein n=1 Tax=Gonapodya prolifera (strain JEL478) TaxID=1344416 RepID=A0A139A5L9_GONPJ|nr:carbohydrate esterase family 4 protein [Gonapodya prolifera JEL478]|eukprot:KXS11765.1 carbohydrate esterase family 4 protein [Gonapodya prolifera JEL478]
MAHFPPRDLVGYGPDTPKFEWPGGAKLAISFVVNYEEGGETSITNGDERNEIGLNESPPSQPRYGSRDVNMETMYEYGSRVGVWRIARAFEKRDMRFTVYAVGRAVELNPSCIKTLHAAGHEIGSHHYRWTNYGALPLETVREHTESCIKAIRDACGQPPTGWYTGGPGGPTPESRREVIKACKKEGVELVWESDSYNDDLPYYTWEFEDVIGGPMLIIPYTLDNNDLKFAVPPGFSNPNDFVDYIKDSIDVLLEEGRSGHPKMMSVGLHCRLMGRPGRAAALDRVLEYVKSLGPEVWVATRSEIAQFWTKTFPKPTKRAAAAVAAV